VKYQDQENVWNHIRGPSRSTEEGARKDLEEIRKEGEKGKTREEGLEMMLDEARRLKNSARYEAEIRETLRRRDSRMDESDYEDGDMSEDPEEYTDADDIWMGEDIEDSPEQSSQPNRPTLSPIEATAELTRFRPIKSTPSDLKYLLEARADPNMPVKPGGVNPLQNVMCFGREKHVSEMRDLLLRFGANESDDDRERWELRRRTDFCERLRINSYRHVDKKYDPTSGNLEC